MHNVNQVSLTTKHPRLRSNSTMEAQPRGTLIVVVLKARHLPNRRKLEKQDPYVILRLNHLLDKTSTDVRGGQTPDWNHEIRFNIESQIEPTMRVSILDETKKTPVLVSEADVDVSPSFQKSTQEGYDKWHPLFYCGKPAGEVYLEMTFYPSSPIVPAKIAARPKPIPNKNIANRPLPSVPGTSDLCISPFGHSVSASRSSVSPTRRSMSPNPPSVPSHKRMPDPEMCQRAEDYDSDEEFYQKQRAQTFRSNSTPSKSPPSKSLPHSHRAQNLKLSSPPMHPVTKGNRLTHDIDPLFESTPKQGFRNSLSQKLARITSPNDEVDPLNQLEFEVQSDWEKNNNRDRFKSSWTKTCPSRSGSTSPKRNETVLPNLPKNDTVLPRLPAFIDNLPPPPPPKKMGSSPDVLPLSPRKSPQRKPPPLDDQFSEVSINLPFSADSIGNDTKGMVRCDKGRELEKEKSDSIIDPKYHAPTPNEQFYREMRLQSGVPKEQDLTIDVGDSSYAGNGEWSQTRFSPSRFSRKPQIPVKVPLGMSESEYYMLEREKYLNDLHGRRE